MVLQFTISGKPTAKGRPRLSGYGAYTPKKTADYERQIRAAYAARCAGRRFPPGTPITARFTAYFSVPDSCSKRDKARLPGLPYTKKPDFDNLAKIVCDALNGIAYDDDSRIYLSTTEKRYAPDGVARMEVVFTDEEGRHGV